MRGLAQGKARVVRGLVMSAACLFFPGAAHMAAGGAVPTHAGFLLGAALLSVACVGLADRRRYAGEIACVLFFSQPALHVLLVLAGQHGGEAAIFPSTAMLVAHGVAASVLTVLLAGAEAVAWAMQSLSETVLLRRARHLLATPAPGVSTVALPALPAAAAPRILRLVYSTPERGPPAT